MALGALLLLCICATAVIGYRYFNALDAQRNEPPFPVNENNRRIQEMRIKARERFDDNIDVRPEVMTTSES